MAPSCLCPEPSQGDEVSESEGRGLLLGVVCMCARGSSMWFAFNERAMSSETFLHVLRYSRTMGAQIGSMQLNM
jgi:hypothetical protein